jgi:hypothetical protein
MMKSKKTTGPGPKKPVARHGALHPDKLAAAKKKNKMSSPPTAKSKAPKYKQDKALHGPFHPEKYKR